jgi:hypothetical protein
MIPMIAFAPTLTIDVPSDSPGSECVIVKDIDAELLAILKGYGRDPLSLQSLFRVSVVGDGTVTSDDLPAICGQYRISEDGVTFIPHFPFESGIRFLASFDPRPLGIGKYSEQVTLEFSIPGLQNTASPTDVTNVFPSSDLLPENLLRFYLCFSNPMQRGGVEKNVVILDSDGKPAPDVLYRAPVELWDRSMRRLTVLLDPGRLKRGVGPNRELGPPLKAGLEYTLVINSGLLDWTGRPLRESVSKSFRVIEPVREHVALEQWKLQSPMKMTRQPLTLLFPRPLDWAMLSHYITIVSENGQRTEGSPVTDECETRWIFTPTSPWSEGSYLVEVASVLEDVSGNSLLGPFDRPLRSSEDRPKEKTNHSIRFAVA